MKILLDFSAITLPNIFVRTVLSKKGNHFTWPVYFLILKQLKCWIRMVCYIAVVWQAHKNNVQGRIVVKSPDTNVLVLLVHYFQNMKNTSELWFQTRLITSTKDCRRYIPVHDLCKSLSSVVCEILPADHALTGCDTASSFFGIGKNSMFKALKEPPNQFSDLSRIEWFSRSKPKTNIKAVWSEGKVETMPYRSCG